MRAEDLVRCPSCGEQFGYWRDAARCCTRRGVCNNSGCPKQVGHVSNCAPTAEGAMAVFRRRVTELVAELMRDDVVCHADIVAALQDVARDAGGSR